MSPDAGKTWQRFEAPPLRSAQSVAFDLEDVKVMYATAFGGGIWKGRRP